VANLYLDHDVQRARAELLRKAGHQVATTRELGLAANPDHLQLLTACRRGSVLITRNRADFIELHGAWLAWTAEWGVVDEHRGIVVIPHHYAGVEWSADYAAGRLEALFEQGFPRQNELYRWEVSGWSRNP